MECKFHFKSFNGELDKTGLNFILKNQRVGMATKDFGKEVGGAVCTATGRRVSVTTGTYQAAAGGSEGDQTRALLWKTGLARRAIFASFLNCKNVSEIILKFYLQLMSQHDEFAFILKKQREKQE